MRLRELLHIRSAGGDRASSGNLVGITITARRPFSARCLDVDFLFALFYYRWQHKVGRGESRRDDRPRIENDG